ncbi:MAG: alpha/beta hydrolase [Chitinophagaceae bacterium]|nr:alpha/beta hydrolase [Oligoflexus sp.]
MRKMFYSVLGALSLGVSALAYSGTSVAPIAATDEINWKLFFNQMFALELHKEFPAETDYQAALKKFTAYTPNTFNETLESVLSVQTAEEAYRKKSEIYGSDANYKMISSPDFAKSIPSPVRALPPVADYLASIQGLRDRRIDPKENFFESDEAKNFIKALSHTRTGHQDVALVMVPGYAAHIIKFEIFPELMQDINTHWQRPPSRPILSEGNGFDFNFESYKDFYGRKPEVHKDFDILHPAGWEMGNTIGFNAETADLMADWIKNLPTDYAKKKLVLFGYSKGAGIVLEMLQRHPDLKSRVIGLVTYAGVIQGTHIARFGRKEIEAYLGNRSLEDFIQKVRSKGVGQTVQNLAPFLSGFDLSFLKLSQIKKILDVYGVDTKLLDSQSDRVFEGREVKEFLNGIEDLAPDVRTAWNIRYLDNNLVAPDTFFFNLSAVTDISSWATRLAADNVKIRPHTLLTPVFKDNDKIDWPNFSLDAWFLYLSSLNGFKLAPGGLYDAQVDLQHTKSPWLDNSPLSASLTAEEITQLWDKDDIRTKLIANGVTTLDSLRSTPRSELLRPEVKSNFHTFDLGEIRAHHWSLFHQAFRAPADVSQEFAVWDFPRKAYMRAVLQTIGLYNVVAQSSSH